ncbi:MAG: hypothetical protein JRJ83_15600 [Deltaproteobacteria bacterium]|nr:hypothetical protein [Deltaproteobacteria bacterium]
MEFVVRTEQGRYDLEASVRTIGQDLLVAVWGGEKPHIGAVSAAQPRPSLKDPARTSSSASVICFLGHKEDELTRRAALRLSAALNTRVVVTAGIHWDASRVLTTGGGRKERKA